MLELRPCAGDDDLAVSLDIYNRTWPSVAISLEEVHAFNEVIDDRLEIVAVLDGEPIGSGVGAIGPAAGESVFTLITVLPDERLRGAGTALYEAISTWARERGGDALRTRAHEDDPDGLDYALRRGFAEVGRDNGLALDLQGVEAPAVAAPEGVEIASLAERPEAETQIYDVALEAYPDIPGSRDHVFGEREAWLRHEVHSPANRPDAVFVALAAGETIGYAMLTLSPARPGRAFHGMTAVRRAWRGRGVAGALKRAQVRWALANGLERLETTNEVRNEPMQRVNVKLGYGPTPGTITLEGPLAPA